MDGFVLVGAGWAVLISVQGIAHGRYQSLYAALLWNRLSPGVDAVATASV